MHCKGANPGNCCYHKHCREKTFSDFPFLLFHTLSATGSSALCQEIILAHPANVRQLSGSARALACRS
jgi:hypothetical protein